MTTLCTLTTVAATPRLMPLGVEFVEHDAVNPLHIYDAVISSNSQLFAWAEDCLLSPLKTKQRYSRRRNNKTNGWPQLVGQI